MTQLPFVKSEDPAVQPDAGEAISATSSGTPLPAASDALPDLSQLSLGDAQGSQPSDNATDPREPGHPAAAVPPSPSVHITVHAHGTPVTINLVHGNTDGPPRAQETPARRVLRVPAQTPPAASPARIRLPAPLPAVGNTPVGLTGGGGAVGAVGVVPQQGVDPLLYGGHPLPAAPAQVGVPTPPAFAAPLLTVPAQPPTPVMAPGTPPVAMQAAAHVAPQVAAQPPPQQALVDNYEYIAPRDPTHTRWYVVTAGHRVGIWREWVDMAQYVTRVPGNLHKSFDSRAAAEAHYYATKAQGDVEIILP